MATLQTYWKKRDFGKTAEPRGKTSRNKGFQYVIQKHDATRLHYDLRLELDGVMMSWAVTRGPSLIPGEKRLAIHVEDHPIQYNKFEGTIPEGEYGGGTVMIWDRGTWSPDHDPRKGMQKGHLDFELNGEKLKGRWHLVRMRKRPGERQEPWLLIKATDEAARKKSDPDVLEEMPDSAVTGRSLDEIAGDKKKVWHSNRKASARSGASFKAAIQKAMAKPRARAPRRATAKRDSKKSAKAAGGRTKAAGGREGRLPDFIEPCLATLSEAPPQGAGWVHEIKFDGYRIQARIADDKVTLKTRTGLDWTERFPTVAKACAKLARHDAILDGEIASVGENGASDFSALQDDLKNGRHDRMIYYVFDLLYLDGQDLTPSPLVERKRALAELLSELPKNDVVQLSEHFEEDGEVMLKHACDLHLEGIVSKRADVPYRLGRGGDWLKTKCASNQEFVVIGYEPSDKRTRLIRSLLLGYYDHDQLRYAGRIGTGWGQKQERDLQRRLQPFARPNTPLDKVPEEERLRRGVKWVEPHLVVEVDFRGWTGSNLVRQGSLKGIREDKPANQVVRETGQMPGQIKQAALRQKSPAKVSTRTRASNNPAEVAGVKLSHPDRVYWEDGHVTKQMLAEYYTQVWDWIGPHVTDRVLALVRCPDGAAGQCFFQKHASAGITEQHLKLVPDDGDKSIAIDSVDGLVALAQAGVLEIHVRGSTIEHLEEADRLVFDLDPGPGVGWKDVIEAARDVRKRLSDLGLESFVKTTGGKGLHVVLPIKPTPWDEAKDFCRRLAEDMSAAEPDRFLAVARIAARKNKIFIDYLRNSREATAIAPYSTRARKGATVSVPLTWEELSSQKTPNAFTLLNVGKRLARLRRDPWEKIGRIKQALPAAPKKTRRR